MKQAILFLLLCAGPLPGLAQAYPTKQEITTALKDVDYVFRRFEEVSDRINFGRWKVTYEFTDTARDMLQGARNEVRTTKTYIANIETSKEASSLALLQVYEAILGIAQTAGSLGNSAAEYGNDVMLAKDLINTATAANKTAASFRPILWKHLEAQERELMMCRATVRR